MRATTIEDLIDQKVWFAERIAFLTEALMTEKDNFSYESFCEVSEEVANCTLGIQVVDQHLNLKLMEN